MTARPIKVLVVDDSAVVRRMVTDALQADKEIQVVGTACDPLVAQAKIAELSPDVLTLDIEMPRMDGLTFLGILMKDNPMPVVLMSSLSHEGSHQAMEALRLGAVEVIAKPGGPYSFGDLGPKLVMAVKAAAKARIFRRPMVPLSPAVAPVLTVGIAGAQRITATANLTVKSAVATPPRFVPVYNRPPPDRQVMPWSGDPRSLIVLGASTGGTEALRDVLVNLPPGLPPIAIVQHIPAGFSRAFADRLNGLCRFPVREATDGEALEAGNCLIAPGNFHMLIRRVGAGYRVELSSGPQVWHQRPAVDVMFKSVPDAVCGHVVAGVLTGMGKDGAEGLKRLRTAGAATFAQDEATCVVYGMPREAWEQGGAERQVPLPAIADHILKLCRVARPAHARA